MSSGVVMQKLGPAYCGLKSQGQVYGTHSILKGCLCLEYDLIFEKSMNLDKGCEGPLNPFSGLHFREDTVLEPGLN